jgi:hypothetical protein
MATFSYATGEGTTYTLKCVNDSVADWVFYIYQRMPQQPSDIFSLAWFASPYKISPGSQIVFDWSIDYSFVWGNSGVVQPGVNYNASGSKPCSLTGNNQTTFSLDDNAPQLSNPTTGGQAGSLTVNVAGNVPNLMFATGIGMSNQGTFVQQALQNAPQIYTPEPEYYIAAGTQMQMGVVLAQTITGAAEVKYPQSVYTLTATLGSDQKWTIS